MLTSPQQVASKDSSRRCRIRQDGLEYIGEWKGKHWLHRVGLVLLVFGLFLEMWEAVQADRDVADLRERSQRLESTNLTLRIQLAQLEKETNPRNKVILSCTARAEIDVHGTNMRPWPGPILARLHTFLSTTSSLTALPPLIAGPPVIGAAFDPRPYVLTFEVDEWLTGRPQLMASNLDNIAAVSISAFFLPPGTRIAGGFVDIKVNSVLSRTIRIPPQTLTDEMPLTTSLIQSNGEVTAWRQPY